MKKIVLGFIASLFITLPLFAGSISADEARSGIVGAWKLVSFEKKGVKKDDYTNRDVLWIFDGKRYSIESDDLGGKYEDSYKVKRSMFTLNRTILILSEALRNTHLPHGKLVVDSIVNDVLTIIDYDDEVTYTLTKVK